MFNEDRFKLELKRTLDSARSSLTYAAPEVANVHWEMLYETLLGLFRDSHKVEGPDARPTVRVPGETSLQCPECQKKAYRRVVFHNGDTGWFCYACEHKMVVPEMRA